MYKYLFVGTLNFPFQRWKKFIFIFIEETIKKTKQTKTKNKNKTQKHTQKTKKQNKKSLNWDGASKFLLNSKKKCSWKRNFYIFDNNIDFFVKHEVLTWEEDHFYCFW